MNYYEEEAEAVLHRLRAEAGGLSGEEAARRLTESGKNKLKEAKKESLLMRFLRQIADPMILVLLAAALVSGVLAVVQNESFADVIIILAVVLVNAILGVYQENKAEKAIEALQKLAAATSKVRRDGRIVTVKSEDLVPGDIVVLEAGDAVPADGRLLVCASLQVEEAALTGESVPVTKRCEAIGGDKAGDVPLGDRKNMVYMGSTVVYGRGEAVITETGMQTEMGKIAEALSQAEDGRTPLQIKLTQLSKILTWLVLAICLLIFGVQVVRAGGFDVKTVLDSFMIAVSLAVAAIPEGLAAVVTVVLSIGVTNMSKRGAIIRRLTAVETLGCAQIICSDKTGTLTQNRMTVVSCFGEDEARCASAMALCSDAEENADGSVTGEPTEEALVAWSARLGCHKPDLKAQAPRIGEIPFDSGRKRMSTLHRIGERTVQYTKGASDTMLDRCTHYLSNGVAVPMTEAYKAEILHANKEMADRALRVLACAERVWETPPLGETPDEWEEELCFIGLAGMIDPIRPEVKAAVEECHGAGIRTVMITGDHLDTARAIAGELGILTDGRCAITGAELDGLSEEDFAARLQEIAVYARVQPEHKTRIVNAWRAAGYVTAMTGDGVNDAPSIKAADIGVGMGITGTDVTKNVADMVLADDNFATIVSAVEEGRRIYDNIRKAIQFLLASNMSEVISIFAATLLGFTILKPVHLLWINLVTDCFPALALGMERAESDLMRRQPRETRAGVFAGGMGTDVAYQGLLVSAVVLVSYLIGHFMEAGVWSFAASRDGMTMAFLTMSMAEIFHSFNLRSQRGSLFARRGHNPVLWASAAAALLLTTAVCEIPFLAHAFGFTSVSLVEYAVALLLGALVIPVVELIKACQRRLARG